MRARARRVAHTPQADGWQAKRRGPVEAGLAEQAGVEGLHAWHVEM